MLTWKLVQHGTTTHVTSLDERLEVYIFNQPKTGRFEWGVSTPNGWLTGGKCPDSIAKLDDQVRIEEMKKFALRKAAEWLKNVAKIAEGN